MKRYLKSIITDKNGVVVIAQSPNFPLLGALFSALFSYIAASSVIRAGFLDLSMGFLFVWAYLEVTRGTTYFRQILGSVVMAWVIVGYFS